MRVTEAALNELGKHVRRWQLIPSDGGRFELTVNGDLIYSKLATGRHTDPEEVNQLLTDKLASLE